MSYISVHVKRVEQVFYHVMSVILFTVLISASLPPSKLLLPYLRSTRPLLPLPKLARLSNSHSKWPLQRLVPPQQHQNQLLKRRLPNPRQRKLQQRLKKRPALRLDQGRRPQAQQQKGKVSGTCVHPAFVML